MTPEELEAETESETAVLLNELTAAQTKLIAAIADIEALTISRDTFQKGFETQQANHEAAMKSNVRISREKKLLKDEVEQLKREAGASNP